MFTLPIWYPTWICACILSLGSDFAVDSETKFVRKTDARNCVDTVAKAAVENYAITQQHAKRRLELVRLSIDKKTGQKVFYTIYDQTDTRGGYGHDVTRIGIGTKKSQY